MDREKNTFKDMPDCECCKYAAGIYFMMDGALKGKSLCPWCLEIYEKIAEKLDEGPLKNIADTSGE